MLENEKKSDLKNSYALGFESEIQILKFTKILITHFVSQLLNFKSAVSLFSYSKNNISGYLCFHSSTEPCVILL